MCVTLQCDSVVFIWAALDPICTVRLGRKIPPNSYVLACAWGLLDFFLSGLVFNYGLFCINSTNWWVFLSCMLVMIWWESRLLLEPPRALSNGIRSYLPVISHEAYHVVKWPLPAFGYCGASLSNITEISTQALTTYHVANQRKRRLILRTDIFLFQ